MPSPNVFPLTFQSHNLSFSDWISVITLALAPLIAHVLTGAPRPSYLVKIRPKWHDYIVHYNPASVLWRYMAIADRRVRARDWNNCDLAATNALFWTSHGWDGSEAMIEHSVPYCLRLPERTRATLVSTDMAKTVVLTLQGAQALYVLVGTFFGLHDFSANLGLDTTFSPVAVLSIFRLAASPWLTDDYMFVFRHDLPTEAYPESTHEQKRKSLDSLLELGSVSTGAQQNARFGPVSVWRSRLCRAAFAAALLGLWIVTVLLSLPLCWAGYPCADGFNHAASTVVQIAFYLAAMTTSVVLCIYYSIRGRTTSTVIPCISATWYKAYTTALVALAGILFATSAVETRQTPCGRYSKLPGQIGDVASCSWENQYIPFSALGASPDPVGIAFNQPLGGFSPGSEVPRKDDRLWLYNFTEGACILPRHFITPQEGLIVEVSSP